MSTHAEEILTLFDALTDNPPRGNLVLPLPAPIVRSTDPQTSKDSAALVQGSRAASEHWVVGALHRHGPMTDEALLALAQREGERWSPSRLRTARKEAGDHGRVAAHDTVKPAGRRFAMTRWAVKG